jgi:DNA-directed RNA polymerase subunit RPC12/RpoP
MIKFRCTECQHKIAVPNDYEGKYVKCPACAAPTLARNEPIEVKTVVASHAPVAVAAQVRSAAPKAMARTSHIPEARPVRHAASGLATSQASELLKSLGDPPSTTSLSEELTNALDAELAAAAATSPTTSSTAIAPGSSVAVTHRVPHAHPPQYLVLQILGFTLLALSAMTFVIWGVTLAALLAGSDAVHAMPGAAGPAIAVTFGSGLVAILWVAASGQALLALRDIARNSWYHKEAAALLRHHT